MDESDDTMSAEDVKKVSNPLGLKVKQKKRSLVERELETNLTARVTSPATYGDATSTSRYGRARRLKTDSDFYDSKKALDVLKSIEKSPVTTQPPVYKMHASNSPLRSESPKKAVSVETFLENQIENIYQENISLSRFSTEEVIAPSPAKKFPKVYIRKDLIQKREPEETIMLIKNMFSPTKITNKTANANLSNVLEKSSEKYKIISKAKQPNGYIDNSSVVKMLDFDSKKKKKENKDAKSLSKNELFELEAKCVYQVGDIAWARMGTFPFWPCIITRDPASGIFVKKKLFGRVEHDVIHVTFLGDNGRRSWIVDNMLRKYLGQLEFESTREQFTLEHKKRDPRLYAAFLVNEKKQPLWNISVEEAEMLLREPKRLRIDILNDMLEKSRLLKTSSKHQRSEKITRTDSDVSLSESLYDTLFSEDDGKIEDTDRSRNKSRNKSLDVSDVVTACLDNMAAKTGITKIQRQSHMDRWLQKAKSKTPEKAPKTQLTIQKNDKVSNNKKKKNTTALTQKPYSFRNSTNESPKNLLAHQNDHDYSKYSQHVEESLTFTDEKDSTIDDKKLSNKHELIEFKSGVGINDKGITLADTVTVSDRGDDGITKNINANLIVGPKTFNTIDKNLDLIKSHGKEIKINESKSVNSTEENKPEVLEENNTRDENIEAIAEFFVSPKKTEPILKDNNNILATTIIKQNIEGEDINKDVDNKDNSLKVSLNSPIGHKFDIQYIPINDEPVLQVKPVYRNAKNKKPTSSSVGDKHLNKTDINISNDEEVDISSNTKIGMDMLIDEVSKTTFDIKINNNLNMSIDEAKIDNDIELKISTKMGNAISMSDDEVNNIEFDIHNTETKKNCSDKNETDRNVNVKDEFKEKPIENKNVVDIFLDSSNNDKNRLEKYKEIDDNHESVIFDDEETSDEEPSPEYEPIGAEVAEEFPKYIMSVENTIIKGCSTEIIQIQDKINDIVEKLPKTNIRDGNISKIISIDNHRNPRVCSNNIIVDCSNQPINNDIGSPTNRYHKSSNIPEKSITDGEIVTKKHKDPFTHSNNERHDIKIIIKQIRNEYDKYVNTAGDHIDNGVVTQDQNTPTKDGSGILTAENCTDQQTYYNNEVSNKIPKDNHTDKLTNGYDKNSKTSIDNISSDKSSLPKMCSSKGKYLDRKKCVKQSKPKIIPVEINVYKTYLPDALYENSSLASTNTPEIDDDDFDIDAVSINSEDSEISLPTPDKIQKTKRKLRSKQKMTDKSLENPDFLKYLELRQDSLMDDHPELHEEEIVAYLYQTWLYEENAKSNTKKSDDVQQLSLVKGFKEERSRKNKNKFQPKTRIDNYFLATRNKQMDTKEIKEEIVSEAESFESENNNLCDIKQKTVSKTPSFKIESSTESNSKKLSEIDELKIKEELVTDTESINSEDSQTFERILRSKVTSPKESKKRLRNENKTISPKSPIKVEVDMDTTFADLEEIEVPLIKRKQRSKVPKTAEIKENDLQEIDRSPETKIKAEIDAETASIHSEDSETTLNKLLKPRPKPIDKRSEKSLNNPEFVKYLELRQDALVDENPQLSQDEIATYLFKTWLYEENAKSDFKKSDDIEQAGLVKGLKDDTVPQPKRVKKKSKTEKDKDENVIPRNRSKRKTFKPYYKEEFSDIEDEIEIFEIFKSNENLAAPIEVGDKNGVQVTHSEEQIINVDASDVIDEVELYFSALAKPKPNVFKGLVREKVCEICEKVGNLVKCKGCNNMYHIDCVKKEIEVVNVPTPSRGRKKKKKLGRRPKSMEGSESQSDDKSQDVSGEMQNMSVEDIIESETHTVDADTLEMQLSAKMKELMDNAEELHYDSYSSDDGVDWSDSIAGKCEIVDVKLKRRSIKDYSDFKCNNCQKYDTPVCFVCKSAVSKTEATVRQKCHVAHCHKYYHLECLDHWPQTQFSECDPSRTGKKNKAHFEVMTCPRHVCHTCVSDDPRGCKTRFSGDKLARCLRCPATYHSFTKCLPAGTQILTGSHIICPRHYDHRPGKIPCHVNTGWCFICALGGSLICCEYCPTSFHAECLNIKPPEGGYMCEDCETGRLPLYGEMVWVKLGHYRWWPGIILHPCEIPENIMAVKHGLGEFVVRFFGQYDHYWVNRGRVFPFQEGDSGRISSQKSKIDEAFTMAMKHAKRACEILKSVEPNEEESVDIASSFLPPHYVKLKTNKPCGALCGRRVEDPSLSLTQCDCDPAGEDPCGPLEHCLNRMLLTECGPTCRSGERCNNRAFEKRLYPRLAPYRTPHRGWGLKTLEDIKAGQFVIEYVGELIDEEEFKRRMRRMHEIRDENFYFLTLDKERMIDAGPKGNLARFMNHSCEPNCETQKWTVLGDVRVGLFALYDIPANSEVTFNYNLECAGIDKKRCLCGAKRCSGYIGAKPKQEESQSKKGKECKVVAKRTYKKRKNIDQSPSTSQIKPKRPLGRPPKPKELTEIEKDLLIIKNATNCVSSDESSRNLSSSEGDRNPKALKRKRVNFSSEEIILNNSAESPSTKKPKLESEKGEVGG